MTYTYMILGWKKGWILKIKQGDFSSKLTITGVNQSNKTSQRGVVSLEIMPQVCKIRENHPNWIDFISHKD